MSRFTTLLFILSSTLLTACHQGSVHVQGSAGVHVNDDYLYEQDFAHIAYFGLIDSYLNDSRYSSHGGLALDPFIDNGQFEVYWNVSSYSDYTVSLFVNDSRNLNGAILIGSDYCGPFESCDSYGMQVCEYGADFYLGCGIDLDDAYYQANSVESLLPRLPETVYLSLEVCPSISGLCEIQSIPVTLY